MLLLLMCHAGDKRFALPIHDVVEVVGRPHFESIPQAACWVAGAFVHRGHVTPVIDLAQLIGTGIARSLWSSRVIVLKCQQSPCANHQERRVGVLVDRAQAEQVPETRLANEQQRIRVLPWGPTLLDEHGTYCLLDIPGLLSPERQTQLFPSFTK